MALHLGLIVPVPADISTVNPAEGTIGSEFTITGSGFGEKRGKVRLGDERCKILSWSDAQITCRIVMPQLAGDYVVSVSAPGNIKDSAAMTFSSFALRPPQIAPAPPMCFVKPGEVVTIAGAFFGDKKGDVYLRDTPGEAAAAKVRDWRMDSISFEIPDGLTGFLTLGVTNEVGLDIHPSWGTLQQLVQAGNPASDHAIANAHKNASGIYFNGHLWVFWSEPDTLLDTHNDIHTRWYTNNSFVSPPSGCGGTTDAQVVPLVIAHELWVFHTGENGGLYYKRYQNDLQVFESSWHRIGDFTTDHDYEIAPVYDPIQNRIALYYWNNNAIYWVSSNDRGTNWAGGGLVTGLPSIATAPSALFYQETATNGMVLLGVGIRYADGIYPAVFAIENGGAVRSRILYPGPKVYGRPFLADMGEDYAGMTWVEADNSYPYLQKVRKETLFWLPLTVALAHPSDWPPSVVVDLEEQPDLSKAEDSRSLRSQWNANLYMFWGRRNATSTTAMMSSVEMLGFWQEIDESPKITNLGTDMTNLFHLWAVIGVIDAPPFIQNGQLLNENGTYVVFGSTAANTARSETSMKIGPYFETGERSPLKLELSMSVGEQIAKEVTTVISFEYTLERSLEGRVGVYYLVPEFEVHKVRWNNPYPTADFMYPTKITTNTSARFLIFDPTQFPRGGLAGMQGTYFDLSKFPLHQKTNDWTRLATYVTPPDPYWFGNPLDWNAGGSSVLQWTRGSTESISHSDSLEFKIGPQFGEFLGFGVEGSFQVQTETTTTITSESALHLDNPDPFAPDQISHFTVEARWLAPAAEAYWVPLNRRYSGDKPWFITYGVSDIY